MSGQAVIADRRFQHYEGKRLGVLFSFTSLVLHSIAWVLGVKRSARYKIVPIIVIALAYLPSLILIVVATVAPSGTQLPQYADFYQFITAALYIFVALTAPELICPDRRHGTLRMYMTSNLDPISYVFAKLVAAWGALAIVTTGPVLIEFAGYSLFGHGANGVVESLKTLGEIVSGGLMLAVFFGSVALAISSLTDRNAFASAGIILGFILTGTALAILQGPLKAPEWVALLNVNQLPFQLVFRIFQAQSSINIPTWEMAAALGAWVLVAIGVLVVRYQAEGRR